MKHNDRERPGFDRPMTREEINLCPIGKWEGPIRLIRNREELSEALERLAGESLLGFDTETRPAYTKGVSYPPSLLQLAGAEEVFIFRLKHLGLAGPLRELLANPAVTKAGVSLAYDLRELGKLSSFTPAGFADLGLLARKAGIKNHGLRGLAAVLLGFRVSKGAQTTNWAKDELTPQQIRYAATDAWVGRQLYLSLAKIMAAEAP
ncbi:3'-5' exonuclease [Thiovibrio sp. JS02]